MSWKREGDVVTLTLTPNQYANVLVALGIAARKASRDYDRGSFHAWLRLANAVNEGNPDWTPHRERHKLLHQMLDEIVRDQFRTKCRRRFRRDAGRISHVPRSLPSETTLMQLMEWSHAQTINPVELGSPNRAKASP
ncbi:MAG TPA: hypothetical protein VGG55_02520 [Candidatus Acidoferrales bacterium]